MTGIRRQGQGDEPFSKTKLLLTYLLRAHGVDLTNGKELYIRVIPRTKHRGTIEPDITAEALRLERDEAIAY
jgi:hypothetical protein